MKLNIKNVLICDAVDESCVKLLANNSINVIFFHLNCANSS